jgi:hypothetical protein
VKTVRVFCRFSGITPQVARGSEMKEMQTSIKRVMLDMMPAIETTIDQMNAGRDRMAWRQTKQNTNDRSAAKYERGISVAQWLLHPAHHSQLDHGVTHFSTPGAFKLQLRFPSPFPRVHAGSGQFMGADAISIEECLGTSVVVVVCGERIAKLGRIGQI